ncbi:MAG: hypothetical protein FD167_3508, partial [bacterium]
MILFLRQATLVCFTKQQKKGKDVGKTKLKPVTIYLTKEEHEFISKEAFEHGTSLNYFLRALIDQYSPIKLPPLPK